MPFFIGYFGKSDEYKTQIYKLQANYQNATVLSYGNLTLINGKYHAGDIQDNIIPIEQSGLLVGKLFSKDTYHPINSFPENIKIETFSKQFWGRYSGVLYNSHLNSITLVRDPVGLNTLFYITLNEDILFASELSLLYDVLLDKPELNFQFFAEYIIGSRYQLASTPFQEIYELQPGMKLNFSSSGKINQNMFWDLSFINEPLPTNEDELTNELIDKLKKCTQAWFKDSKGVCVELSGGLDSSSVAILLKDVLRPDQKLIAVNYIDSKAVSANEIEYAQQVSDACEVPLYFLDCFNSSIVKVAKPGWRPNKPTTFLMHGEADNKLDTLLQENGCAELTNGQGGDHIFLAPALKNSLSDYWLQKGFKGSSSIANELSSYYREPWISLIKYNIKAISNYYLGKLQEDNQEIKAISKDYLKEIKRERHYLHAQSIKYTPAKAIHMQALSQGVHFSERNQRMPGNIHIHPLLSQPVVEFGWRIPAYQAFGNGYDRILYRKAVSKIKNVPTLWRKHKGETSESLLRSLKKDLPHLMNILQKGKLLESGVIDKEWFDKALIEIQHGNIENVHPLINMLTAEQWIKQWNL